MQSYYKCSGCQEEFNEGEQLPQILDCGQNLCKKCCFGQFILTNKIQCPQCKTETYEFLKLQTNNDLIQEINSKQDKPYAIPSICKIHQLGMNFYCNTDQTTLCRQCKVEGEHINHDVKEIGEVINFFTIQAIQDLEQLKQNIRQIEQNYKSSQKLREVIVQKNKDIIQQEDYRGEQFKNHSCLLKNNNDIYGEEEFINLAFNFMERVYYSTGLQSEFKSMERVQSTEKLNNQNQKLNNLKNNGGDISQILLTFKFRPPNIKFCTSFLSSDIKDDCTCLRTFSTVILWTLEIPILDRNNQSALQMLEVTASKDGQRFQDGQEFSPPMIKIKQDKMPRSLPQHPPLNSDFLV